MRAWDDLRAVRDLPALERALVLRVVRAALALVLTCLHVLFGLMCLLRPDLFEQFSSVYGGFHSVMPTVGWGWVTIGTGLSLLLFRSVPAMAAQFVSAVVMALIALIISVNTGPNTGTATYGFLSVLSFVTFGLTFGPWLGRQAWYVHLQGRVGGQRAR